MATTRIPEPPQLRVEHTQDRAIQQLQRWAAEVNKSLLPAVRGVQSLLDDQPWPVRGAKWSYNSGTFELLKSVGVESIASESSGGGVDTRITWRVPFPDEHYIVTFGVLDPDYTSANARIPQIKAQTRDYLDVYVGRADGGYESTATTDNVVHVMAFGGLR